MGRAKVVATPAQAPATQSATLMQQTDHAKPRRQLKKQNTEIRVSRCIRDNFSDLSEAEVRGLRVDGLTLVETLARDKRLQASSDDGEPKMGKFYMADLREKFALAKLAKHHLSVMDRAVPVDLKLVDAMEAALAPVPDYAKILGWMQTIGTVNQTTMVGLCKFLLDQRPGTSQTKLNLLIEGMRCMARLGLHVSYAAEMEHMRTQWDITLCTALQNMKRSGMQKPLHTFWSVHRSLLCT